MLQSKKFLFNGATDDTGYGHVGTSFLKQLINVAKFNPDNIQVKTDFSRINNIHGDDWEYELKKMCLNNIGIPDLIYNLWNPVCSTVYDNEIPQILETVFETNVIQENWVKLCNMYDQTWVPSKFCVDAFKRSGVANVEYLPYGFDFSDDTKTLPVLDADTRFKYLFINQWSNRKFAKETVETFCKTFRSTDNVVLYLRTFVLGGLGLTNMNIIKDIKDIKTKYPDSPQVILLDRFNDKTLPRLYNSVDCLLSPSRGEGVGRTIVEAMSHGLPVITTNWSAMAEYASDKTAYMLDYNLTKVVVPKNEAQLYYFEREDMEWAEPNRKQLADYMLAIKNDPTEAQKRGQAAKEFIREYYSWDKHLQPRLDKMTEACEWLKV